MDNIWKSYNSLPTLLEAKDRFMNREQVFSNLTRLLSKHGNAFGVCLVHTHCTLVEGEIMLDKDDISQPVGVSETGTYRRTKTPPETLLNEFRNITQEIGVLGLYHVASEGAEKLEWTEGRQNLNLGKGDPVTMACILFCTTATTERGGYHLERKVHYKTSC
ncbi:hypothetical protein P153DRAFT_419717 [Dothidotthia symphoricarpi CBS 119687]|uniref:Uncharacterized protein n=1 Tax=Dothidotthia symphoricarpi CBS 119687 TaxID=1392245 RepID=A0A6A6ASB3_9PLEO|nr:uncharacterized protein P153DRAFT_419717 [Dothidotthia symphoricarpi CBS 119687]KAF2133875.1 hypothetical protein P153DRAFT_419717 [Dothidotthia symphoricarpi CBS 119687]